MDAERRASETKQAAQHQADDILTEANSKADRIRSNLDRELAALANRRDSIGAQLTNVRAMLATLTGSVATSEPGFDDEA
jgi:cell division septum initiation protein DivIVA